MKKKNSNRFSTRKQYIISMAVIVLLLALSGGMFLYKGHDGNKSAKDVQKSAWEQLSADDRKIASLYAEMYEVSKESVADMKQESDDWNEVYTRLETAYFTIGETEKYQMAEDGYLLDDLYEAEVLARKTGKRAIDLAKAKGKSSEGKKWSDVLEDTGEKSIEEKLGLTKQQVKELEKKKYSKDERIEIAILCFNRQESVEDVIRELESGKTIAEMKEETNEK